MNTALASVPSQLLLVRAELVISIRDQEVPSSNLGAPTIPFMTL